MYIKERGKKKEKSRSEGRTRVGKWAVTNTCDTTTYKPSCLGFSSHYIVSLYLSPFRQRIQVLYFLYLLYILLFFRFTAPINWVDLPPPLRIYNKRREAKTFSTHAMCTLYIIIRNTYTWKSWYRYYDITYSYQRVFQNVNISPGVMEITEIRLIQRRL